MLKIRPISDYTRLEELQLTSARIRIQLSFS